jgi:alcohol dehydrogenase (cytochrome c)
MRTLIAAIFSLGLLAQPEDADWLSYGNNLASWRYSPLAQIDAANVKRLTLEWVFQTGVPGKHETSPIISGNLMYVTGPENAAWALDLASGRVVWSYTNPLPPGVNVCCGNVNRGFAVHGDTLYKTNVQATLAALDARTGGVKWEVPIEDPKKGYSATVAPIIAKDKVIVGIAGAEFGTRGFLDAYDVKSGKRLWRFWTTAGPGEFGSETWPANSNAYQLGGGSTWVTGSYDPDLNLIYWGTGNPGPDMNGVTRPGDNLFTCSLIAIDADTGKRRWHFQFTPHDLHDWDATEDPVLIDLVHKGRPTKAVVMANRNGYFYALDRTTGELLTAREYTKVDWAKGFDAKGRPILVAGKEPTEEGNIACPGGGGGHNWQPTSYSPRTGLYYFPTTDGCHVYWKTGQQYVEGQWYQASTFSGATTNPVGAIVALEPATGETKWRFPLVTPPSSGVMATAGGLVFSGDPQGYFFALDARTGKALWHRQLGGSVIAGPVSWARSGRQFITIAAGQSIYTFALPKD